MILNGIIFYYFLINFIFIIIYFRFSGIPNGRHQGIRDWEVSLDWCTCTPHRDICMAGWLLSCSVKVLL